MPHPNLLQQAVIFIEISLFAYEDKENIVRLIVETYERLVLTLSVDEEVNIPWELWVKTSDND